MSGVTHAAVVVHREWAATKLDAVRSVRPRVKKASAFFMNSPGYAIVMKPALFHYI